MTHGTWFSSDNRVYEATLISGSDIDMADSFSLRGYRCVVVAHAELLGNPEQPQSGKPQTTHLLRPSEGPPV